MFDLRCCLVYYLHTCSIQFNGWCVLEPLCVCAMAFMWLSLSFISFTDISTYEERRKCDIYHVHFVFFFFFVNPKPSFFVNAALAHRSKSFFSISFHSLLTNKLRRIKTLSAMCMNICKYVRTYVCMSRFFDCDHFSSTKITTYSILK